MVAVIGHGVWMLMAAAVRWMQGQEGSPTLFRGASCSACGAPHGMVDGRCGYCGFQPALAPKARSRAELAIVAKVLGQWSAEGLISEDQSTELQDILARQQASLETVSNAVVAPSNVELAFVPTGAASAPFLSDEPQDAIVYLAEIPDEGIPSALSPAAMAESRAGAHVSPKEVHPLDREDPAEIALAPAPTLAHRARRQAADVLQAFMEDKNIRWGEVIAGLLIVGSAIGCVVSLQETLRQADPYVPAFLFLCATAAIYGAGTYTLRRWDLQSISRAILIIALLLAPLNFLAATSSPEKRAVTDPVYLLAVALGLGAFSAIVFSASRTLVRHGALRLTVAVMGAAASQLYLSRLAGPSMGVAKANGLFLLPTATFLFAVVGQARSVSRWKTLTPRRAEQTFIVVGVAVFSLAAAAGLFMHRSQSPVTAMEWLSPTLSVVAAAVVALGLGTSSRAADKHTGWRTAALAIAILGASLMTANLLFAWPEPTLLMIVGLFSFVSLSLLAAIFRQPVLHGSALVCLTLAYLVGFHLILQGDYDPQLGRRWLSFLWMGRTSAALGGLAIALVVAGCGWTRANRPGDARAYFGAAGALAGASALLALGIGYVGGPDAHWTTLILAIYAVMLLAVAVLRGIPVAAVGGSALLLATLVHAVTANDALHTVLEQADLFPRQPILSAALVHGLLCAGLGVAMFLWLRLRSHARELPSWYRLPAIFSRSAMLGSVFSRSTRNALDTVGVFTLAAVVVSTVASPFALLIPDGLATPAARHWATISVIWLAAASVHRRPWIMSTFGWAATVTVVFAAASIGQRQAWWNESWLHPRHLQLQISALAVWSLAWTCLQRSAQSRPMWKYLIDPPWVTSHQAALGLAVLGSLIMAALGCVPGVSAEMGVAPFDLGTFGGANSTLLYDSGGWVALSLALLAAVGALAERVTFERLLLLSVALAATVALAAALATANLATGSALRWWFAGYGAAMAVAICARRQLSATLDRIAWVRRAPFPASALEWLRAVTFLLTLAPILGLTLLAAVRFLAGESLAGPGAESFFAALSPAILYAGPMLAPVAILSAYAVREKQSDYLMIASVLFQTAVTLACLMTTSPFVFGAHAAVTLVQWNAVGLGMFACIWNALRAHMAPVEPSGSTRRDLVWVQIGLAAMAVAALGGWATVEIFQSPANPTIETRLLGGMASYVALAFSLVGGAWYGWRECPSRVWDAALLGLAVGGTLVSASITSWSSFLPWPSYYGLILTWLAAVSIASIIAAMARHDESTQPPVDANRHLGFQRLSRRLFTSSATAVAWVVLASLAVVILSEGALYSDPWRPWFSALPTFCVAMCMGVLSIARKSRLWSYAGTALTLTAASFLASGPFTGAWRRDEAMAVLDFLNANILAVVVSGAVSLAYDLRWNRHPLKPTNGFGLPVYTTASTGATAAFGLITVASLMIASLGRAEGVASHPYMGAGMGVFTAIALGALLVASLWNKSGRSAIPCLYVWGAACVGVGLDRLTLELSAAVFAIVVSAASYVMLTSLLWRSGIGIAKLGARLGVPEPVEGLTRLARWLPAVTALQAVLWTFFAFWMVLGYADRGMRYGAALVPLLLAMGLGSMAQHHRRGLMQHGSLILATVAVVFLGWADIPPDNSATVWLVRCVRLLIVLAAVAAVYGGVVIRLLGPAHAWREAVRRMTVMNSVAALVSLVSVLVLEWSLYAPERGVQGLEGPQIFAVAVALLGLAGAFVSFALLPKYDPFLLTETQRIRYVYTAEVILALLFAHLYMTLPELFTGIITPYWAYLVVAIAYVGVGLGEVFQRAGVRVLAEPLGRTGVLLPLLPAIAFWTQASLTSHAGVLFWVGLLYVILSIHHKSYVYGIAAGLAGNAALWALMQDHDVSILEHPQFWLIPPAVSVLLASHLTRDQLKDSQKTAIRYLAMLVIYLSSTGEMFIAGIGDSLWPVMVLMAFSVAGVLAGIGLRIRAFLYLGAGFLTLSVLGMVWHASRALEHVWPWWAFGFSLGIAILVLFALFEKRRDELLHKVEQLQTWES